MDLKKLMSLSENLPIAKSDPMMETLSSFSPAEHAVTLVMSAIVSVIKLYIKEHEKQQSSDTDDDTKEKLVTSIEASCSNEIVCQYFSNVEQLIKSSIFQEMLEAEQARVKAKL